MVNKTGVFEGKFSLCDVARGKIGKPLSCTKGNPSLYNLGYAKMLIHCTNPGSFYFLFDFEITYLGS